MCADAGFTRHRNVVALLIAMVALLLGAGAANAAPTITSVLISPPYSNPDGVYVDGIGFGNQPPPTTNLALAGYTGYDYGNALYLCDTTANPNTFCAGQNNGGGGDLIGLLTNQCAPSNEAACWNNTRFFFDIGSSYTSYYYPNNIYRLNAGDHFTLTVEGATCSGTISTQRTYCNPPLNTSPPSVAGTPQVGQSLTCSPGAWVGSAGGLTYQWQRDGSDVPNATGSTYTVQSADSGHSLVCAVTATNPMGSTAATSPPFAIPSAGPPPPQPPPVLPPPPLPPGCATGGGGNLTSCTIQQVVFVHGIRSSCDVPGDSNLPASQQSYVPLYDALQGGDRGVYTFCYDHDIAFGSGHHPEWDHGLCFSSTSRPEGAGPSFGALKASYNDVYLTNTFPLAASQPPGVAASSSTYDGDGPLAYDATKLDSCLRKLVAHDETVYGHPVPIAVIGNSMGGAITRGWLQFAKARGSSALTAVTTVVFLEGAIQGSWIAAVGQGTDTFLQSLTPPLGFVADEGARSLASLVQLDPSRPGVRDLTPRFSWYQSIVKAGPPPRLHYFSFSTDIYLDTQIPVLWWTISGPSTDFIGDGIMELGSQSASALPAGGGSQFLPFGSAADQHQYVFYRHYPLLLDPNLLPAELLNAETGDPYGHFNFGNKIGGLTVPSCNPTLGYFTIPIEIDRIFSDPAQACDPPAANLAAASDSPMTHAGAASVEPAWRSRESNPTIVSPAGAMDANPLAQRSTAEMPVWFIDRRGHAALTMFTSGADRGRIVLSLSDGTTYIGTLSRNQVRHRRITLKARIPAAAITSGGSGSVRLVVHGSLIPAIHFADLEIRVVGRRTQFHFITPHPSARAAAVAARRVIQIITSGDALRLVRTFAPQVLVGRSPMTVAKAITEEQIQVMAVHSIGTGHLSWLRDGYPIWTQRLTGVARTPQGRRALRATLTLIDVAGAWKLLAAP